MTIADGTDNRLLPSLQLIERVLAADVSYTISEATLTGNSGR